MDWIAWTARDWGDDGVEGVLREEERRSFAACGNWVIVRWGSDVEGSCAGEVPARSMLSGSLDSERTWSRMSTDLGIPSAARISMNM